MTKNQKLENFEKLVSNDTSSFLSKFAFYKANKKWLDQSSSIAVTILLSLKEKGWSQKQLAENMKVSAQQINKIVKGKENLTLETISKLENALGIALIETISYSDINSIQTKPEIIQVKKAIYFEEEISKSLWVNFSDKNSQKTEHKLTVVHNINYSKPIEYRQAK
jgi:transcriptional regulator with XRE-family HTH domain